MSENEPVGIKGALRSRLGPKLPMGSKRRSAVRMAREVYRVGTQSATTLRRRALENIAAADASVPYSMWLAEHRRVGQPPHMPRLATRSVNPVSVDFVVTGGADVGAQDELGHHVDEQWWGRTAVVTPDHPLLDGSSASTEDSDIDARLHAVVFVDANDRFEPDFALRIADAFWENPAVDVVFWDTDVVGLVTGQSDPKFLPEWSPDLMLSANPIGRSFAIRLSALHKCGGLDDSLADDRYWDLLLRAVPSASATRRITRVIQHVAARVPPVGSHAVSVVNAELQRREWPAKARNMGAAVWLDWELEAWPKASIVIPSRFTTNLLQNLLPTLEATDYPNFDVTIVDNSGESETKAEWYAQWSPGGAPIQVLWADPSAEFNYSAVNNMAVANTDGDIVVLLNDDTEATDPRWLREMVGWASRPEIGTVGLQLLDAADTIQHGGVVLGMFGLAEHLFGRMRPHSDSLIGHTDWIRNSLAVTAACVAVRRELWDRIGGFDERFILCGSDVVLGLDAHLLGFRNVCSPATTVHHLESATRGSFNAFADMFTSYWRYQRWITGGDPYFSPNLSLQSHEPKLRLDVAPTALDLLGPALGRKFGVFKQSMSEHENRHLAAMCDLSERDVAALRDRHAANAAPREVRSVVWFLPEFDSPFYGGINTALRMADYLRTQHGVENRFCFISGPNEAWFRSALRASFPGLADAKMAFADGFTNGDYSHVVEALGHADCAIATIWHTAFTVAAYPGADRSCYLIQDFEPGFYPNGTLFALAEESYKLGLYGICNSPTMAEIYRNRYNGVGAPFMPAVDRTVFHPPTVDDVRPHGDPLRVFLYARPGHWRNCWELASGAIARIKATYGDQVHFVSAGSWARPNDLDLGIEQLGLLDYASTGDLYRTCDVGIALTVSEHPSYLPLELNACGVPVIAFDLPAGYWILKDGENSLLARRTISSLADNIERLITDDDLRAKLSAGADRNIEANHASWDAAFAPVYDFLCDPERVGKGS